MAPDLSPRSTAHQRSTIQPLGPPILWERGRFAWARGRFAATESTIWRCPSAWYAQPRRRLPGRTGEQGDGAAVNA